MSHSPQRWAAEGQNDHSAKTLKSGTVLRGLLGGAAVSVALPPMEAFFGSTGTAFANETNYPTRFGIFAWGNGVHPQYWIPDDVGTEWVAKSQLQAFENVRSKISVITGMEVKAPNVDAHGSGPAGLLSGVPILNTDGYIRSGAAWINDRRGKGGGDPVSLD